MTDDKISTNQTSEESKPGGIWDNDLPAGDSPPLPRWPLTAAIVACCLWMVFLVCMMIMRITYAG